MQGSFNHHSPVLKDKHSSRVCIKHPFSHSSSEVFSHLLTPAEFKPFIPTGPHLIWKLQGRICILSASIMWGSFFFCQRQLQTRPVQLCFAEVTAGVLNKIDYSTLLWFHLPEVRTISFSLFPGRANKS